MQIKEGWNLWEIAPKFDWKNLRENFVNKKIYNIGNVVENLNTGLVGKIIRRGTNYLICVTEDNIMFKSWLKDLIEVSDKMKKGYGTAAYTEYTASKVAGQYPIINKLRQQYKNYRKS